VDAFKLGSAIVEKLTINPLLFGTVACFVGCLFRESNTDEDAGTDNDRSDRPYDVKGYSEG
jgi:hypothetical protein